MAAMDMEGGALKDIKREDVNPIEEAGPPCCKLSPFRLCCEVNPLCKLCGKIGCVDAKTPSRNPIFYALTGLSVLALILQIVLVCGTSTDYDTLKNSNWAEGKTVAGKDIYMGAKAYVVDGNVKEWESTQCTIDVGSGSTVCEDCKDTVDGTITSTYTGLIASVGQILTDYHRSMYENDLNFHKTMAVITGIVGILTNIITISTFYDSCVSNFDDLAIIDHFDLGPGMVCLIVSTIIKGFNVVVHAVIPTPEERH